MKCMTLTYDKDYVMTFHSPGIEPWICGFLKSKKSLGNVLDIGCGLGFSGFLLKLYVDNVKRLVGVDISAEKISKARTLGLYDELYVADIRDFKEILKEKFDTVLAIEVLHRHQDALNIIEALAKKGGNIVLTLVLPSPSNNIRVKDIINRGYSVYKYLLRGLILVNLKSYDVLLAGNSKFLKIINFALIYECCWW